MEPVKPVSHGSGFPVKRTRTVETVREQYSNLELQENVRAKALAPAGKGSINIGHDYLTRKMPVEIIAEIFKATLTRTLMPGLKDHVIDSPLFLGAVCQTWRKIAWSAPALWNWIHISLRRPASQHLEETVKEWIGRSGRLPLVIQITCGQAVLDDDENSDEEGDSDEENNSDEEKSSDGVRLSPEKRRFGKLLDYVNACSARWENVSFEAPSKIISALMGSCEGSPNLKMVRINTDNDPTYYFRLQEVSRPLRLVFCESPDSSAWINSNIAWDNLIDIHLAYFNTTLCVPSILQMPRLKRCVLIGNGDDNDLRICPRTPFIHENLEEFSYETEMFGRRPEVHFLFDYFVFPNLIHLRIVYDVHAEAVTFLPNGQVFGPLSLWEESIKPFIERSSSRLKSLELQIPCELDSFVEALESTKHLSKLVLSDSAPFRGSLDLHAFIVHLANTPPNTLDEDEPFLASLESLSISGEIDLQNSDNPPLEAILDLCGQRSDIQNQVFGRPLRHIAVKASSLESDIRMSEENVDRLSEIDAAGITVEVIDPRTGRDIIQPHRTTQTAH